MEVAEKCGKCNAAFGKLDAQVCSRCGWDSQIDMRKCVKCKNPVVLQERPGYGPMGGLVGLGGFVFWFLFGLLLGGAIAAAIASVCAFVTVFTLKYACTDCGKSPETRLLDAEEKGDFKKRRLGFLIGAVGFGVLAVALFGARILLFIHGMNSTRGS